MSRPTKLVSKFHRLRMSDEIRGLLNTLPLQRMQETQVGNYVYQGFGELLIGESHTEAVLRIRMVRNKPRVSLKARRVGISVECGLEEAGQAVQDAIHGYMN